MTCPSRQDYDPILVNCRSPISIYISVICFNSTGRCAHNYLLRSDFNTFTTNSLRVLIKCIIKAWPPITNGHSVIMFSLVSKSIFIVDIADNEWRSQTFGILPCSMTMHPIGARMIYRKIVGETITIQYRTTR